MSSITLSRRNQGHTCAMVHQTKLLIRECLLPLKRTTLVSYLLHMIWIFCRTDMVYSVNGIPLVSIAKYTDGPTVWSDESRNKYDPGELLPPNSHLLCFPFLTAWNLPFIQQYGFLADILYFRFVIINSVIFNVIIRVI